MRAAAIFGLGYSPHNLKPFQDPNAHDLEWRMGLPAAGDEADVILLFGGDGTIHRHLGQLVKLALPVLIVPMGSGNDFARALGLRSMRDSRAAWNAHCARKGTVRSIDLGVITPLETPDASTGARDGPAPNGTDRHSVLGTYDSVLVAHYFCSVAGVGLDADVARRASLLPRWLRGNGGYALSFAQSFFQFAPFPLKILTPESAQSTAPALNQDHAECAAADRLDPSRASEIHWTVCKDQPTILAAFANTSAYGGGMKIAPRAQMDDGLLDVCTIAGIDPFKLACLFPTVYFGRHLGVREVDYFPTTRLRLETGHPLDLYADGEYVCRTPVEISVERAALRVICPPVRGQFAGARFVEKQVSGDRRSL